MTQTIRHKQEIRERIDKYNICLWGREFSCKYDCKNCKDYTPIDEDILELELNNFIEKNRNKFYKEWWEIVDEYN